MGKFLLRTMLWGSEFVYTYTILPFSSPRIGNIALEWCGLRFPPPPFFFCPLVFPPLFLGFLSHVVLSFLL